MRDTRLIDLERERAARTEGLFGEVNEHMDELAEGLGSTLDGRELPYLCECLDPSCTEPIRMPRQECRRIRHDPAEFFVVPGHKRLHVEQVVDREARWLVVRKLGTGRRLAAQLAQPAQTEAAS